MRDFRSELLQTRFWNQDVEKFFRENGEPIVDCALQNREDIIALCEWIEANGIRSYLEIGCWTGRLTSALHQLFSFDVVAACDLGSHKKYDLPLTLPPETLYFEGNSHSPIFQNWRTRLGKIDLVLIDGDHSLPSITRDFNINAEMPHRFIAIHGITGGVHCAGDGAKMAWERLLGEKHEIKMPHPEIGSDEPTMGIGIWTDAKSSSHATN